MALKQTNEITATFSMASMTDVIFLLLIFFMVTSTYVFPTAIEVNLPEGVEQTPEKPSTRIFIDKDGAYFVSYDDGELASLPADSLVPGLSAYIAKAGPEAAVAVYADVEVPYGKVVEVLNLGAQNSIKMVLATRPSASQVPQQTTATNE